MTERTYLISGASKGIGLGQTLHVDGGGSIGKRAA